MPVHGKRFLGRFTVIDIEPTLSVVVSGSRRFLGGQGQLAVLPNIAVRTAGPAGLFWLGGDPGDFRLGGFDRSPKGRVVPVLRKSARIAAGVPADFPALFRALVEDEIAAQDVDDLLSWRPAAEVGVVAHAGRDPVGRDGACDSQTAGVQYRAATKMFSSEPYAPLTNAPSPALTNHSGSPRRLPRDSRDVVEGDEQNGQ
jgi:hypothetical protein